MLILYDYLHSTKLLPLKFIKYNANTVHFVWKLCFYVSVWVTISWLSLDSWWSQVCLFCHYQLKNVLLCSFFLKWYQLLKLERFTQNVSMRDCKWPMCCRAGFLDMYQLPVSISTRASLWLCWGWVCCVQHGRGESVTKQFVPFRAVQTYPWLFETSPP